MRALIIDDSRAMRMLLHGLMKELGFEVVEAGDGLQALEVLESTGAVDVALVDWNMPVMDGHEFVLAVRARPEFAGLRLIMVTTETEMDRVASALDAGADEYAMKPVGREVLAEKLGLVGIDLQ